MSDRVSKSEQHKPGGDIAPRQPWVRPELKRMAAADAELGTRPAVPDGSFSVS